MAFTDFLPASFSNPRMSTRVSANERASQVQTAMKRAIAGTGHTARRATSSVLHRASTSRHGRPSLAKTDPGRDVGPIAGVMSGGEWNNCLQAIYSKPQPTVIHTIILPEGVRPRDLNLKTCKVVDDKRYTLKSGEIPKTACCPAKTLEVFMPPNVCPRDAPMPGHFLVNNTVDGHRQLIDSFKNNKAAYLSMGGSSSSVNRSHGGRSTAGSRSVASHRTLPGTSRAARGSQTGGN